VKAYIIIADISSL